MSKTVFITGVTGFIGQSLAAYLHEQGYQVIGSTSKKLSDVRPMVGISQLVQLKLGDSIHPDLFSNVDTVIHGAYTSKKGTLNTNVLGTVAIAEAARKAGVSKQILLSSYSALTPNQSEYAEAKRHLESHFHKMSQLPSQKIAIVRPGLVIGRGGVFARMATIIQKYPIVPLLDGGRGLVPIIWIGDLVLAIKNIIDFEMTGDFNLFHPQRVMLQEILFHLRKGYSCKTIFVSIPSDLIYWPVKFLELLKVPMPINSQNIKGYQVNQAYEAPTHLHHFTKMITDLPTATLKMTHQLSESRK